MDAVAHFYSGPQLGNGISIYSGSRRQMGSGLWGTVQRIAIPILSKHVPRLGRTVVNKALDVLSGAASDALSHRASFLNSVKTRGRNQAKETLNELMRQTGGRRSIKRRKSASKKRPPTKRRKTKKTKSQKGNGRRSRFLW